MDCSEVEKRPATWDARYLKHCNRDRLHRISCLPSWKGVIAYNMIKCLSMQP